MLVIGSHSFTMLENNGTRPALILRSFFDHTGYGVDIFFALSGFLISSILLREKESTASVDLTWFYIRRVFRILPPIVCYLMSYFALIQMGILPEDPSHDIIGSFLFARNYIYGSWYTGHFWSLSIEEHFYAVIPCLILVFKPRALLTVSLSLVFLCVCIRVFEFSYPSWFQPLPQFRTENRVDALLWGSIIAQLCRKPAFVISLRANLTWRRLTLLIIISVILLVSINSQSLRRSISAFVLPLVICYTSVLDTNGVFARILENSALKAVGRISYSLYIWQMMFLVPGIRPMGALQGFPLALILPLILAYISFRWIESPMIRLGHRLADARRAYTPSNRAVAER